MGRIFPTVLFLLASLAGMVEVSSAHNRTPKPAMPGASVVCGENLTPAEKEAAVDRLLGQVILGQLQQKGFLSGEMQTVEANGACFCFAPGTSPDVIQKFQEQIYPRHNGGISPQFWDIDSWTSTSMQGWVEPGQRLSLTYSFVPDGTPIVPLGGEAASPSSLFSYMNALFQPPHPANGWRTRIRQVFQRWSEVSGVTFIETVDDGALFGARSFQPDPSPGVLGVRGDIRIALHAVDGPGTILAYARTPSSGGDLLLDAEQWNDPMSIYRFLGNVTAHEIGHTLGLTHVLPRDGTKLMEAIYSSSFEGPQDDDIRGIHWLYGDAKENNNSAATATETALVTASLTYDYLSIRKEWAEETDWFRFSVNVEANVAVTVTPVGGAYLIGDDASFGPPPALVNTQTINRLAADILAADGATILASGEATAAGNSVTLNASVFPSQCPFYVKVRNAPGSQNGVQRYSLRVNREHIGFYVDRNHTGPEQGTPENPFRTVTAAINAVGMNETKSIYIKAGNYGTDRPRITKRVSLRNWGNTGQAAIGRP